VIREWIKLAYCGFAGGFLLKPLKPVVRSCFLVIFVVVIVIVVVVVVWHILSR
jgi:hypothetical protein